MKSIIYFLAITLCLCFNSQTAAAQTPADTTKKNVITVLNLTCDGDMPTIKKRLLNQDGIESVEFSKRKAGTSEFTILFDKGVITIEQIHKAIESTPGCDDKSTTPYRVKKARSDKDGKS